MFQSPIRRGNRCNIQQVRRGNKPISSFSPLLGGAIGVTPGLSTQNFEGQIRFSPLLGGAIGVTMPPHPPSCNALAFQSPIRRGNRCNNSVAQIHQMHLDRFQSPIRRGNRCNFKNFFISCNSSVMFQSPIRRGNRCNITKQGGVVVWIVFQSPIRRGNRCNVGFKVHPAFVRNGFSPLLGGAIGVTGRERKRNTTGRASFSPLLGGAIGVTPLPRDNQRRCVPVSVPY